MKKSPVLVNLGCGERAHPEWINIDYSLAATLRSIPVVRSRLTPLPTGYRNWNLRKGIPLQSNSVDVVYASHLLEHIDHAGAPLFLAEIARVLKPAAIVRLVVPDLETAARNYLSALDDVRSHREHPEAAAAHEFATILLLDQMVRSELGGELATWLRAHADSPTILKKGGIFPEIARSKPVLEQRGRFATLFARAFGLLNPEKRGEIHRWMYDEVSLTDLLRRLGFRDVTRVTPSHSRIEGWARFGLDTDSDGSPHHPDSLWIEAIKGE